MIVVAVFSVLVAPAALVAADAVGGGADAPFGVIGADSGGAVRGAALAGGALEVDRAGGGYPEVLAASRSGGDPRIGLSKQTFWIRPKIAEVDGALCTGVAAAVFEVHPELWRCVVQPAPPGG